MKVTFFSALSDSLFRATFVIFFVSLGMVPIFELNETMFPRFLDYHVYRMHQKLCSSLILFSVHYGFQKVNCVNVSVINFISNLVVGLFF